VFSTGVVLKLCYVDETGTDGESPFLVMVGVVVDAQRLTRTQAEFGKLFGDVSSHPTKALTELKAADLYRGNGSWRGVDGATRTQIIGEVCSWVGQRKHKLVLAAIDRQRFKSSPLSETCSDDWIASALHIALQVQKAHQSASGNKGKTMLVFDVNKHREDPLAELLYSPPAWSDDYYGRSPRGPQLDQVIDSAFFARSHHVGLVQIADVYGYLFRRYAELCDGARAQWHERELEQLTCWIDQLAACLYPVSTRWPRKSAAKSAKWYVDLAPPSLASLG
jgi:hypothetical protein